MFYQKLRFKGSELIFIHALPCNNPLFFSSVTAFSVFVQAFVLKYLLFFPDELGKFSPNTPQNLGSRRLSKSQCVASYNFASLTEDAKAR